jgi:hypothetical protein
MGNADETPTFFDMPTNASTHVQGSNSVVMHTIGCDKLIITVILSVLADGKKSTHVIILKNKTHINRNYVMALHKMP